MKYVVAILGICLLTACAATTDTNTTLGALAAPFTLGIQAADAYFRAPLCGTEKPGQFCQKPAVAKVVHANMDIAVDAYGKAVQSGSVADISTAQMALGVLTASTPVQVK